MNNLLSKIDLNRMPEHVAIILDGNGRWAKERLLPRVMGHAKGVETLKELIMCSKELGIKNLTVFAFSTENINRPIEEVNFLMNEFLKFFQKSYQKLLNNNINVQIIGEYNNLSNEVVNAIKTINSHPINKDNMIFTICFNYGSKQEIVHSVKQISNMVKSGALNVDDINEEIFEKQLYTNNLQPLDLIIRTSGEYRLSNFLLWQAAYAEFYFTNTYFPDFGKEEFYEAIINYQARSRRFGKIGDK